MTALKANSNSWPFVEPVDPNVVHDYYDVIKYVYCFVHLFVVLLTYFTVAVQKGSY